MSIIDLVSQHKVFGGGASPEMELWPVTKTLHIQARRGKPEGHMILSGEFDASIECEDSTEYRTHLSKSTKDQPNSLVSKNWRLDLKPTIQTGNAGLLLVPPVPSVLCRSSHRCLVLLLLLYFSFLIQ